jgi:hypothetical protein
MSDDVAAKRSVRSAQHKFVAADTFGFRIGDNGAQITFGLESADAENKEYIQQEVTIVLTLRSLKVLQLLATTIVEGYEKTVAPIPIPAEKEAQLRSIKIAVAAAKPLN